LPCLSPRGVALLDLITGLAELSAGSALFLAPEPTTLSKWLGLAIMVHAMDRIAAAMVTLMHGDRFAPLTEQLIGLLLEAGIDKDKAERWAKLINDALSMAGIMKGATVKQGSASALPVSGSKLRDILSNARVHGRGDCDMASELLRRQLPGGRINRIAEQRLLHSWYEYFGQILDVTAKQYIRPGVWTREELARAGLLDAVESGIFTPEQHRRFLERLLHVYGARP
jgi:hypothetical protein